MPNCAPPCLNEFVPIDSLFIRDFAIGHGIDEFVQEAFLRGLERRQKSGMANDKSDRLESWKEIAQFIRRDKRTAMRWAAQGMPVHRVPSGKRGRIFASREEISQWLNKRENAAPRSGTSRSASIISRPRYVAISALVAAVLLFLFLVLQPFSSGNTHSRLVTRVTFTANAVLAWAGKQPLWKHTFARPLDAEFWGPRNELPDFVRIVDLSKGDKREVILVAPFRLGSDPDSLFQMDVDCFSNSGKLLWSYVPHERFQFGVNELDGPWFVTTLHVSQIGAKAWLWVAEEHYLWGNSFVVRINPETGHAVLRYVNTGALYALNEVETTRGTELLAGGFNNEYSAGILAVINEQKPMASSPQTPGTRHQCVSCSRGVPDEYFVFPRTEINRLEGIYEDPVTLIQVSGDNVEVHKLESRGVADANTIYQFSTNPTFRPVSLRYDSSYKMLYREFQKEGKIRSAIADASEQLHPLPISVWTPTGGWENYAVHPHGDVAVKAVPIRRPPHYFLPGAPEN